MAINAHQVQKKNEIVFSQNNLSVRVRSVRLEFCSPAENKLLSFLDIIFWVVLPITITYSVALSRYSHRFNHFFVYLLFLH